MGYKKATVRLAELQNIIVNAYEEAVEISNEHEIPFEISTTDLRLHHEPSAWSASDDWYDSGC